MKTDPPPLERGRIGSWGICCHGVANLDGWTCKSSDAVAITVRVVPEHKFTHKDKKTVRHMMEMHE